MKEEFKISVKKKILSVLTCIIVTGTAFNSFDNYKNVSATDNSITYMKYTYATNSFTTYDLPGLSVLDNDGLYRTRSTVDIRPNSPLEQTLVKVGNGTGFIIGDHEIMTAAHVVTNLETKEIGIPSVQIATSNPLNENTAIDLTPLTASFPQRAYKEYNSPDGMDYAIITVQEDLSDYGCVFLGLGVDDNKLMNNNVYALGYNGDYQKISSGTINTINDGCYISSNFVLPQTSGGPLYCKYEFGVPGSTNEEETVQSYKTVIGIVSTMSAIYYHDTNEYTDVTTLSTRITPEILQFAYENDNL